MNRFKIIKILNEKGVITTKELIHLGFSSHMISKLLMNGFIERKERGIYTHGSIEAMLDYGNELLEAKDKINSKLVFDYCYKLEPENYDVNLQQLYTSVLLGRNEDVFKYFKFIYDYLKSNDRENDAYYYLFLYSYCYDVPNCYISDYKSFLKSNIRANDSDNNELREFVYTIDYASAKKRIIEGMFSFDNSYESKLEKVFVYKAYDIYHHKNNYIKQNIENGNYLRAKNYLEDRDGKELLNYSQKCLLYIINAYLHTNLTGKIPKEKEISDKNNFYLCIECNQFALAKSILDRYYDNNPEEKRNSNTFYIVLDQYVELINSISYSSGKEEVLTLDNIISMIVDGDYSLIDAYLDSINKPEYSFLINDFIKLAELSNKNKYFVITTLISISTGDYKFNINSFVSLFINALEKKDYDIAKIYLDIISNSSHISGIDIKNSMTKIFETSETLIHNDEEIVESHNTTNSDSISSYEDFCDVESGAVLKYNNEDDSNTNITKNNNIDRFESRIRSILDNLNENRPIALLPVVSSEEQMDMIFNIIDNDYPNLRAFVINTSDGSQAVARYKVEIEDFIDFKELYKSAKNDYINHNYQEALAKYRRLLIVGNPHPGVYGAYGLCLRNAGKREEAITVLKIATGYSKIRGGNLDYSNVIFDLTHPRYKDPDYEKKPYVDIDDYDPDKRTFGVDLSFLDDLIQLVKDGELSFDDAIEKLGLSEIDKNYARLVYARDCYYVSSYELGDKYYKIVEKSKEKNDMILSLLEEIRRNKRFYQNRLDEERKQLVLIK